jgi:hypothetical protein
VLIEKRPFCFRDFLDFDVDGKRYSMTHGTFRNKISTLIKNGDVQWQFSSGLAIYSLKGINFTRPKREMTANRTVVSSVSSLSSVLFIQSLPADKHALHDIRFRFRVDNIWTRFETITNYAEPFVCHQIKESEIPKTNDSILDVGYFVVSDKLNETAAEACISGYHNWDLCNSQTIDADSAYGDTKILEHMAPTYDDVWVNDACLNYHHLKEGTPEFQDCEEGLS